MLQLTTGLIENKLALAIDMTPTFIVPIKSLSNLNRSCVTLGVRVLNNDTVATSIEIKGFYVNGTTEVEYISDAFYVDAGNVASRQYYVQFDAFEFRFFPSSQAVAISAWGINSAGKSTTDYHVRPMEVNSFVGPTVNGSTRADAETGAPGQVEVIDPGEAPKVLSSSRMVYVSKSGDDIIGDGTINAPFATIPKAMNSIVDAAPSRRYSIMVGPGHYIENISLKANVMVIGVNPIVVHIGSDESFIDINEPTWSVDGDNRSGFEKVALVASTLTFDFTVQSSVEGKLYFQNVRCNETPFFTAFSSINQAIIQNCMFFSGYTQTGMLIVLSNTDFVAGGLITVNSSALGDTTVLATGGGSDGSFMSTYTSGTAISISLIGFTILGTLSASGSCNVRAAANSIPAGISFTEGASLTFINDAHSLAYTPANPAHWSTVPATVQEALDQLAIRMKIRPTEVGGYTGTTGHTGEIGSTVVIF
ncbi:MAG TPA: hypothetical protein VN456_11795 [Desulfosporosinus sp.]|nr:hypothetical protein [Desulfosporosinus sp.]